MIPGNSFTISMHMHMSHFIAFRVCSTVHTVELNSVGNVQYSIVWEKPKYRWLFVCRKEFIKWMWFQPEITFQTPTRWLNLFYTLGNRIIKFKRRPFPVFILNYSVSWNSFQVSVEVSHKRYEVWNIADQLHFHEWWWVAKAPWYGRVVSRNRVIAGSV